MIERYTLPEMGAIWQDEFKYRTWLEIEILACEARAISGNIPYEDLELIKSKANFDVSRILEIEETTKHDVIAFLTNVAEYVGPASRHIHYGMTSSDILDTTISVQLKKSGEIILIQLLQLEETLKKRAIEHKNTVCIGRSHGIHAEPTTMGLKFALWFEETKRNIGRLKSAINNISVGQISGAVGTFDHLSPEIEKYVCEKLGLSPAPISTQVIQRDRHAEFINVLALIGASLEKIAVEIRHLQRTEVLEAEEYFSEGQKGSSAMPHKKNPIISERITGIARLLRGYALSSLENIALWHERDISHSSVERVVLPDSCIIINYGLAKMINLIDKLVINKENMLSNLFLTRGLVFSQKVLLKLVESGINREDAYRIVQNNAMKVWNNKSLNFKDQILIEPDIKKYISEEDLERIFDPQSMLNNVDYIFSRTIYKEN